MEKVKVTVEFPNYFEVKVEFDKNQKTFDLCQEVNNFWTGAEQRLCDAEECIYQCVTRLIAHEIIRLHCRSYFYTGVENAIKAFNDGIEGFPSIDGSCGIKLIYCDDFDLDEFSVDYYRESIED